MALSLDAKTIEFREKFKAMVSSEQDAEQASEKFADMLVDWANGVQESVIRDAREVINSHDADILSCRGCRQLTSEETKYYESVIGAMRTSNPQQALSNLDVVMPKTIIDEVFEDLENNHPLLSAISFENAAGMIEIYRNTNAHQLATWGSLTSTITKELASGFTKITLSQNKLSAWMPVANAMLDLGPVWLDNYVRRVLYEALACGLEDAIINGDGNGKPIGMKRAIGAGVSVVDGAYPEKSTVAVKDFDARTFGNLLSTLAVTPNGNYRNVNDLILIVNPVDYYRRVMPATTMIRPDGTYANDIFPVPTKVIQSVEVAVGKAVLGIASKYFMAIGLQKSGKLEYSDEYKFLEDLRTYRIKLYAHGQADDNNAFMYLDITGLSDKHYAVKSVSESIDETRLASLTIGSLTLSQAFNPEITSYTAITTNATDIITAAAEVSGATVVIKNGETTVTSGTAATWSPGSNTVTVTVTKGDESKVYTITVTKPYDPSLSALTLGSLTLSPAFNKDTLVYTTTTTNETNTITATASDSGATVVIKNGDTTVTSGSAATWSAGVNVVTITVTSGTASKVYVVSVTKSSS